MSLLCSKLLEVDEIHQSVEIVNQCSIDWPPVFWVASRSSALADQLVVGSTINDLIVPTADPRVSFGGRGESGFGVTRGGKALADRRW